MTVRVSATAHVQNGGKGILATGIDGRGNAKRFLKAWLNAISVQHRKTESEVGWVFLG